MAMPGGLSAGRCAEFAGGLGWEAQRLSKHSTHLINMPVCSAKHSWPLLPNQGSAKVEAAGAELGVS